MIRKMVAGRHNSSEKKNRSSSQLVTTKKNQLVTARHAPDLDKKKVYLDPTPESGDIFIFILCVMAISLPRRRRLPLEPQHIALKSQLVTKKMFQFVAARHEKSQLALGRCLQYRF